MTPVRLRWRRTRAQPQPGLLRAGVLAGAAGGVLMSISTNTEMRVRGRAPSRVPAQTLERLLGVSLDEPQEDLVVSVGHVVTSAALGAVRGAMALTAVPLPVQEAAFALCAFLPDFALIPLLGDVEAPWCWSPVELATSALHHGVYVAGTVVAFRALAAR